MKRTKDRQTQFFATPLFLTDQAMNLLQVSQGIVANDLCANGCANAIKGRSPLDCPAFAIGAGSRLIDCAGFESGR